MKRLLLAALLAITALVGGGHEDAKAQSGCPAIVTGAVLTAAQWNACFMLKQDYLGFTPVNPASVLATTPITVSLAGGVITIACPTCSIGNGINGLTGDGTATGPGVVPFTLTTVNSGPGSVGSSTAIPVLTTNGKGLVTAQATAVVIAPAGTLTGTTLASNVVSSSLTSLGTIASLTATAASITSSLIVGGSDTTSPKIVSSFSATRATAIDPFGGAVKINFWAQSTDNGTTVPLIIFSAFGSNASGATPQITMTTARGTAAVPTATQSGDTLARFGGRGYGTSQYEIADDAVMIMGATENYTNTAHGSFIDLATKATGTVTRTVAVRVHPSGGVSVGTITDPGVGGLKASGAVSFTAGTASSSPITGTVVVTGGVGVSGAINVGGQGAFGDQLTVTYVNPVVSLVDTGTSYGIVQVQNAGATNRSRFGAESAAGGGIFTGSAALATVLGSTTNTSLQLFTNNTLRLTISGSGTVTIPGAIAATAGVASTTTTTGTIVVTGGVGVSGAVYAATAVIGTSASPSSANEVFNATGPSGGSDTVIAQFQSAATAARSAVVVSNTAAVSTSNLATIVFQLKSSTATQTAAQIDVNYSTTNNATRTTTVNFLGSAAGTVTSMMSFIGTAMTIPGTVATTDATDASALGTASVVMTGGLSVAKKLQVGTNVNIPTAGRYQQNGTNILWSDGVSNTAVGDSALNARTTAIQNTAVGFQALLSLTDSNDNTAFGYKALKNTIKTSGADASSNTALGSNALTLNTVGYNNVAVGAYSMQSFNGAGNGNMAVGQNTLGALTSGSSNAAIGAGALQTLVTGSNATAIGQGAGAITTVSQSALIGMAAGISITTGANNIVLGANPNANRGPTTGATNILIGHDQDLISHTASNQMTIGNLIFGTGMTGTGTTPAGKMGVLNQAPATVLDVTGDFQASTTIRAGTTLTVAGMGNAATTSAVCYNTGTGLTTYNGTVGTCTVSTIAAKNLINAMTPREGREIVMSMEPWWYTMKIGLPTYQPGEEMGLIAEYAAKVEPRMVAFNPDGSVAGVRYEQYTAALTAAFQAHDEIINRLVAANDNLKAEISQLRRAVR